MEYRYCPGVTFGLKTIQVLDEHLSLLDGRFVQTMVICVRNKDKPWFDDHRGRVFGLKQEAHLRWTRDSPRINPEEFIRCQVVANETYSEAMRQFSVRNRDVLMNALSPHKWRSTLKSSVRPAGVRLEFVITSLVRGGGGQLCESIGKPYLLSDHFYSKLSREPVDQQPTYHPSPSLYYYYYYLISRQCKAERE